MFITKYLLLGSFIRYEAFIKSYAVKTLDAYHKYMLMDSIEILDLPEASLKLVVLDIFHPHAGSIVSVTTVLVYSGDVNNRTAVKCLRMEITHARLLLVLSARSQKSKT